MRPLVSVIIPTRNRSEMLERAIRSVLNQIFEDFELIVVSDGSTDNTEEIVSSFKDSRIRFLKQEKPRGASAARNTGLRECKGKYIAFLDDDDEWTQDKLKVQTPVLEKSNPRVGLVYGWIEYCHEGKVIDSRRPTLKGDIFEEMLDKQAITNSSALLIRREVLDVVEGFDESLPRGNDGDFIRRISKHFEVDFVPETLTKVHIGHERITGNTKISMQNEIKALEKRLVLFESDFNEHLVQKANVLALIGMDYLLIADLRRFFRYLHEVIICRISVRDKMFCLFSNFRRAAGRLKCRLGI